MPRSRGGGPTPVCMLSPRRCPAAIIAGWLAAHVPIPRPIGRWRPSARSHSNQPAEGCHGAGGVPSGRVTAHLHQTECRHGAQVFTRVGKDPDCAASIDCGRRSPRGRGSKRAIDTVRHGFGVRTIVRGARSGGSVTRTDMDSGERETVQASATARAVVIRGEALSDVAVSIP